MKNLIYITLLSTLLFQACSNKKDGSGQLAGNETLDTLVDPDKYIEVELNTDLSVLKPYERAMLPHLLRAAEIMDELFWQQAYGDKNTLLSGLDERTARFATINYGPWDRLAGDRPFIPGVGPKPAGANMYPSGITKREIVESGIDSFGQYSMGLMYSKLWERGEIGKASTHYMFLELDCLRKNVFFVNFNVLR